jgi:hypothetical protein
MKRRDAISTLVANSVEFAVTLRGSRVFFAARQRRSARRTLRLPSGRGGRVAQPNSFCSDPRLRFGDSEAKTKHDGFRRRSGGNILMASLTIALA